MIAALIKLANELDRKGLYNMALELDCIITIAAKSKLELEEKLDDVEKRLADPKTQLHRLKELHKVKKNLKDDLEKFNNDKSEE